MMSWICLSGQGVVSTAARFGVVVILHTVMCLGYMYVFAALHPEIRS